MSYFFTKYDVVSEPANANSSITFGQFTPGDADKAAKDARRFLSRGARVPRNVNVAVATRKIRPRRLTVVPSKVCGSDTESLLDSGAVPNLKSENLCNKLDLKVEQDPRALP